MFLMRITVNVDPDVVEQVSAIARAENMSFSAALNKVVRAGMQAERLNQPFRVKPKPTGLRPGVDLTHAIRLASDLEDFSESTI